MLWQNGQSDLYADIALCYLLVMLHHLIRIHFLHEKVVHTAELSCTSVIVK